jgi:hypothetical protein
MQPAYQGFSPLGNSWDEIYVYNACNPILLTLSLQNNDGGIFPAIDALAGRFAITAP